MWPAAIDVDAMRKMPGRQLAETAALSRNFPWRHRRSRTARVLSSGLVKLRILLAAVSAAWLLATGTLFAQTGPDPKGGARAGPEAARSVPRRRLRYCLHVRVGLDPGDVRPRGLRAHGEGRVSRDRALVLRPRGGGARRGAAEATSRRVFYAITGMLGSRSEGYLLVRKGRNFAP